MLQSVRQDKKSRVKNDVNLFLTVRQDKKGRVGRTQIRCLIESLLHQLAERESPASAV